MALCVHHDGRGGEFHTCSVTTGACITARTGRRSRSTAAAGSSGSHGTHFTASCPWYSECVAASPTHCTQSHARTFLYASASNMLLAPWAMQVSCSFTAGAQASSNHGQDIVGCGCTHLRNHDADQRW